MPDCILHRDDPSQCPQEHICICGQPLNEHRTVAAYCPKDGLNFHPDATTLTRFAAEYARNPYYESEVGQDA